MAVEVRLSSDQFQHFEEIIAKAKLNFKSRGTVIEFTKENFAPIRDALLKVQAKNLAVKSKSALHMERIYALQGIMQTVSMVDAYFPSNNNEEGVSADAA